MNPTTREPDPALAVSVHYLIEKDGTIYQLVDESRRAWHAGAGEVPGHPGEDPNDITIGIELENMNSGKDSYPEAQLAASVELAQDITLRRNLTRADHVTHKMVAPGRKVDPKGLDFNGLLDRLFGAAPVAPAGPPLFDGDTLVNASYRIQAGLLYIRQAPNTKAVIVGRVYVGDIVEVDVIKTKGTEAVNGDRRWGHLTNGLGFISMLYTQDAPVR